MNFNAKGGVAKEKGAWPREKGAGSGLGEVVGDEHGGAELQVALEALEGGGAQPVNLQPIGQKRRRERRRVRLAVGGRAGHWGRG